MRVDGALEAEMRVVGQGIYAGAGGYYCDVGCRVCRGWGRREGSVGGFVRYYFKGGG